MEKYKYVTGFDTNSLQTSKAIDLISQGNHSNYITIENLGTYEGATGKTYHYRIFYNDPRDLIILGMVIPEYTKPIVKP